ncbi:hypothetical protein SS50377_22643 [Spironucleus salmonicida]|uniref:Uncharacterized protein n=1 Tax=Spironucleus salmonicida TaxID=348837 RepID=V6LPV4_9EUKA|nr:hypothetical protein SS50377_22643 [Spironucleus salmonicida]|eukprot:EST46692.1 Hypothetical protein SS50377_13285 [Spironucleus salmonicida]
MLHLLSHSVQLTQCYVDQTNLEISEVQNMLFIQLNTTYNKNCNELPSTVLVQITVQNSDLDVQMVNTIFEYNKTTKFVISVFNISQYFDVKASQLRIKSYNQVFEQQIQEITLTRSKDSNTLYNLTVDYDQKTFTATINYPLTFSSIGVTDSTMQITNALNTYNLPYDGNHKVDSGTNTVIISYDNSQLSQVLYDTGVRRMQVKCSYGSVEAYSIAMWIQLFQYTRPALSWRNTAIYTLQYQSLYENTALAVFHGVMIENCIAQNRTHRQ